jgi:CHAT domain-containing protein
VPLDFLSFVQKVQGRDRRRLTLCPTGVLMQLPLHAAGVYAVDHQICCSDYFVPSYVPSIGALLHAQQTYKPVRRADAEMLIVAVEHPFEGQALPMISEESSTVHAHVSPLAKVVQVSESGDVFKHIQSASILHMACHGTQNLVDALQSGFFLEDELLPVSKLMQLDLPQAFLAVLSACETAKGDASQPDQAIHMAATMLFAGFKSVVATMWSVHRAIAS